MALNREEIEPPSTFCDFLRKIEQGSYEIDLEPTIVDLRIVQPIQNIDENEYG